MNGSALERARQSKHLRFTQTGRLIDNLPIFDDITYHSEEDDIFTYILSGVKGLSDRRLLFLNSAAIMRAFGLDPPGNAGSEEEEEWAVDWCVFVSLTKLMTSFDRVRPINYELPSTLSKQHVDGAVMAVRYINKTGGYRTVEVMYALLATSSACRIAIPFGVIDYN